MQRRNFIKKAAAGTIAFSTLTGSMNLLAGAGKWSHSSRLKDNFWLWGQTAGSHYGTTNPYHLPPGKNLMDPKEGCDYLGIEKCCRVAMGSYGPFPPFNDEAEKLKGLKEVVWSALGDSSSIEHNAKGSDIDAVLEIAKIYPNITGAVLDDFFHSAKAGESTGRLSVESIQQMRNELHGFARRRLDLWAVWYTHQLDWPVDDYLKLFDVVTLWEWEGSNLPELDKNIQKFIERTPGKRRLMGCYMWDYGGKEPMTTDQMQHQLDIFYRRIKKGDIEGIVFCSNCIEDIGLKAVEYIRKWIAEVGNEKIYI